MPVQKTSSPKKATATAKKGTHTRNPRTAARMEKQSVSTDYSNILAWDTAALSEAVRNGVGHLAFRKLMDSTPFSTHEWSAILNLSERTMQRYHLHKKTFDPIYSDKILQIAVLYKTGIEVFGDKASFDTWLETSDIALGGMKPKALLDNTFGIGLVKEELLRIENGVLA